VSKGEGIGMQGTHTFLSKIELCCIFDFSSKSYLVGPIVVLKDEEAVVVFVSWEWLLMPRYLF
jgi:hypothetical protein